MNIFKFEKGDPLAAEWRRLWYYGLRHDSGLNDYQLYKKCFLDDSRGKPKYAAEMRTRVFETMRKRPSAPDRTIKRWKRCLLDITDEKFPGTRARYEHPIREVLALPRPTLSQLSVLIDDLARRCGYCRPNVYQSISMQLRLRGTHNLTSSVGPENKAVLKELAHRGGYDEIGLLFALAAEAWYLVSIRPEHISECRFFITCCDTAWEKFGLFPEVIQVREVLGNIYHARIVNNIWTRNLIRDADTTVGSSYFFAPLLPLSEWGQVYEETSPPIKVDF